MSQEEIKTLRQEIEELNAKLQESERKRIKEQTIYQLRFRQVQKSEEEYMNKYYDLLDDPELYKIQRANRHKHLYD